jgi:hypothetical protein
MKTIQELIGNEATRRLKEWYGVLVDWILVEKQGPQIFKMKFQILDYKRTSASPTPIMIDRAIGVGVAEIENALYGVLNFGNREAYPEIHLNINLPKNGIHMHPTIYSELMGAERDSMVRIEEWLGRLNGQKKGAYT